MNDAALLRGLRKRLKQTHVLALKNPRTKQTRLVTLTAPEHHRLIRLARRRGLTVEKLMFASLY